MKLRISKPAPTINVSESATSRTTTALRNRRLLPPPLVPFPLSRKGSFRSRLAACRAGTSPNTRAVRTATHSVKINTGVLSRITASAGTMSAGIRATSDFSPPQAISVPSAAPPSARIKLSTRSWRISRMRPAPSTARIANSFSRPVARANNKIRDVAAADQQQQTHRRQHDVQRRAELADDEIGQRLNLHNEVFRIILRIFRRELMRDDVEIDLRLLLRNSGFQMAHQKPVLRKSMLFGHSGAVGLRRNPHIGIAEAESRGHHTDQGSRRVVEHECLAENAGIGAEFCDPGLVAHHENGRRSRLIVCRLHYASDLRRHAHEFKRAGRHHRAFEQLGSSAGAIQDILLIVRDHAIEDVVLFDDVEKLGPGVAAAPAGLVALGVVDEHSHVPLRVHVRKRLHQDVIHHAENRRRSADSQRQCHDCDEREAACLPKRASSVPNILSKRFHDDPPATRPVSSAWAAKKFLAARGRRS